MSKTTITLTIQGQSAASVQLLTLTRSDTNTTPALPSGLTVPGAMTGAGEGVWTFGPITDAFPGLVYSFTFLVTWPNATTTPGSGKAYGGGDDLLRYIGLDEAIKIGNAIFNVPAWMAANSVRQYAALAQATWDVDHGMRYQGRVYDITQRLEFPRVPWESSNPNQYPNTGPVAWLRGDRIWDWDYARDRAVVPSRVYQAVIIQASSVLDGQRQAKQEIISAGLSGQHTGSLGENYTTGVKDAQGGQLCRRVFDLLKDYRLRGGKIL